MTTKQIITTASLCLCVTAAIGFAFGATYTYKLTSEMIETATLTNHREIRLAQVEMARRYLADGHVYLAPLKLSEVSNTSLNHLLFLTIQSPLIEIQGGTNLTVRNAYVNAQ